jgi:hypothetical protein
MLCESDNIPMQKMHIRLFLSDTNFRSPRLSKVYMTFDHITFVYTTFESMYDFRSMTFVHMTNESKGRLSFYNFRSPRLSKVYMTFDHITFGQVTQLLAKTPPVEIRNPLQWKYGPQRSEDMPKALDPRSGNMVLIR